MKPNSNYLISPEFTKLHKFSPKLKVAILASGDGSNFLKEAKKPNLEFYEVSKDVNKPTNNNISLIKTIS